MNKALRDSPSEFFGSGILPRFALAALLFCLAAALPAGGRKEQSPPIKVTGRVRLVGSATFPELVVSGTDGEWYIAKDEARKLKDLQHQVVTIQGDETVESLKFANGRSAGERHTLRNITIIDIEKPEGEAPAP